MKIGIYPGSFDPITLGHLDIIERASKLVDKLIIGVLINTGKNPVFSADERVRLIKKVLEEDLVHVKNVCVEKFEGLLVDFAQEKEAGIIVRGLRAVTDFEYELQIAQTNHKLFPNIDTVFLTTNLEYSYLSSSVVREIASFGGKIHEFVPGCVVSDVYDKYKEMRSV
ncbi:MAG TPA: pantetheine-phosphate adenylyltransferase [Clostridiales bacterium]|nr:pantetheine-phosphate adenylyltransferase [Clostridiales bacterium]